MMTIFDAVELVHRAKTKVERARRNDNVHDDTRIIDGLVTLVETLQASLRETASTTRAAEPSTWIELREPGKVPERKGPFNDPAHLKNFLIEIFDDRQSALVSVVRTHSDGPSFEDGPECLEVIDGRYKAAARRHRENTRIAWQAQR